MAEIFMDPCEIDDDDDRKDYIKCMEREHSNIFNNLHNEYIEEFTKSYVDEDPDIDLDDIPWCDYNINDYLKRDFGHDYDDDGECIHCHIERNHPHSITFHCDDIREENREIILRNPAGDLTTLCA